MHSRSFESDSDQLFCRGLDHSGTDLPIGCAVARIVCLPNPRLNVVFQLFKSLAFAAAML